MKPWKRIEPTTVTKVGWRTVVTKNFIDNQGRRQVFDTLSPEGMHTAAVLALTADNQVVVARQFRTGPELVMDELPGGYVDDNEEPQAAALRELLEETGYQPESIEPMGIVRIAGEANQTGHYFFARNCTRRKGQHLEDEEDVEVDLISISQLLHNARHGRMTDAAAVLMAYDKLMKIQENA
jgi:ADP-ribose pyrophosphatase